MNILIDENISNDLKKLFQKHGHDILDMKLPRFRQSPEKRIIEIAIREKRLIISHDKDFLPYMTDQECKAKILLLSIDPQTEERMMRVGDFLITADIFNQVTKSAIVDYRGDEINVSFLNDKSDKESS